MFRRSQAPIPKTVDERLDDMTDQIRSEKRANYEQLVKRERRLARTGYPVVVVAGLLGLAATMGVVHHDRAPKNLAATILEDKVPEEAGPVSSDPWLDNELRGNATAEKIVTDTQQAIRAKATGLAQGVVKRYLAGETHDTIDLLKDPRSAQMTDVLITETQERHGKSVQTQVDLGVTGYKVTSVNEVTIGELQKDPLSQPSHTIIMQRQADGDNDPSWSINVAAGVNHPAASMDRVMFRQSDAMYWLHQVDTLS